MDREFLQKVDELKKETFTNEKVAEALGISVSTVKRSLRLIRKGALIPPLHKFFMTGDMYYLALEWDELAARVALEDPELTTKRSYLSNKRSADYAKKMRTKGLILKGLKYTLDGQDEYEKRWLKGYKKWEKAFLSRDREVLAKFEEGLY
jgi:hypothetical protein